MTDDELDFERAHAAMLARGPGRMVPDLDRITLLLELLGQPQRAYPSIHVTGTNGKGSVVRIASAVLAATGLSAGAYTSPHLQTVRERLSVNGRRIGEEAFAALYADVAPLAALVDERSADAVTYFEMLTAMASWWFAEVPVDVGVFEVGMGGTWDATNLVRGEVAVLQPVDVDHSMLGGTPAEIAVEKAGIIKAGAVVVCGPQRDDVMAVIEARADDVGAEVRRYGTDHELLSREPAHGGQTLTVRIGLRTLREVYLPLLGEHQARNAVVALAAVEALLGETFLDMDDDTLRRGVMAASVPGRLEIVSREPTVVLDGAHNPHGAAATVAALGEVVGRAESVVLVTGVLADKDVEATLAPWRDAVTHVVVVSPPSPRAASTTELLAAAQRVWEPTTVEPVDAPDVATALSLAERVAGGDGVVVVSGSLVLVGAARDRHLPVLDTDDEVVYEPEDVDDEDDERRFEEALDAMIDQLDDGFDIETD